jgi:hypothetical protein
MDLDYPIQGYNLQDKKIDKNQHVSEAVRPIELVDINDYTDIYFYCVHYFGGKPRMLMYTGYRHILEHDGLVEDKGHRLDGFQDIRALRHLCARVVVRHQGARKTYIVDTPDMMEERLRKALNN